MGKINIIETPDLFLTKGKFADWKDLYQNLWCHEESAKYMLWNVTKTSKEAKERMKRTLEFQKSHLTYFVYEKNTKQAIGFAGVEEIDINIYEDTGIAIGPAFVGKGYGKQILKGLLIYCIEELGATRFVCSCRSQNEASRGMQISCGLLYSHSEDRVDKRNGQSYVLEFYVLEKVMENKFLRAF